jgi:class 3 adenylate cyclase
MPIFHFVKRPRIVIQLLTWFLTISLLPLAIVTFIVYERSKRSLEQEVTQELLSVAQRQSKQILSYIRERERNATTLSRTPDIIRAMKEFDAAFKQGGLLSTRYATADSHLRPFLTYYQESFDYDDLYLFSSDGYAVFSVTQGEDLGSNFNTGIYRHTGLAEAFDRANTMLETGVSDFDYYPVTNEPAAFIAAPVLDEGRIIGVVALQMNNEAIYEIVNDYTGLYQTGETVIASQVGHRAVFQAPSRHDPYAAFRRKIDLGSDRDQALENAVKGRKGSGITMDYRNKKVLAVWKYTPDMRWGMVTKMDLDEAYAPVAKLRNLSLGVGLVTVVMVVISAIFVARSISKPIRELTWGTRRVAEGDLSQKIEISTKNEIGDLAQSFNEMTEGLKERNFIKETFGKYLSEEIRDEVLSGRIPLDGEFKDVTVMFADLRGFTTMTEVNDPKMIVTVMNSYFEAMGETIQAEGGLILQFLGDEIYAVFGAPVGRHDHPVRAFRAALGMSRRLMTLNTYLAAQGKPTLQHGIGLHTGQVVAANIGSSDRLSYLLVGDTVNLASRLQGLTKEHGVEIILSQETLSHLPEADLAGVELSNLGPTQVKGKSVTVEIYAVKSTANTLFPP